MSKAPAKQYLTTGQAAELCSVTPDTVLKWIRAGRLPANRTPGGHHRIPHSALLTIVEGRKLTPQDMKQRTGFFQYCWEYKSKSGNISDGCRKCIVYRSRTRRCYQMRKLPAEVGHARLFCEGPCEECEYYQLLGNERPNVLVVTDQDELKTALERKAEAANLNLQVTDCEYRCSMIVEKFHPDYVVVDCAIGTGRSRDFARFLDEDPRIPFARVILAGNRRERPVECDKSVFAFIERPFTPRMLADLIGGSQV